jgi:hypothetical protein
MLKYARIASSVKRKIEDYLKDDLIIFWDKQMDKPEKIIDVNKLLNGLILNDQDSQSYQGKRGLKKLITLIN